MHKLLQLITLFSLISTIFVAAHGDDIKCICSDANKTFITTKSGKLANDECLGTSKMENNVLDRLSSIIATTQVYNARNVCTETHRRALPISCAEATANSRRSGIYNIQTDLLGPQTFQVSCDEKLHDGGWTVVLRRQDGSVDFYRDWAAYKHGFGNLDGEFFIGLDKLHALTNGQYIQELMFVVEDFDKVQKYAKYSSFAIGDERERYALKVLGPYSGDAGDSFKFHVGQTFKTKDVEDSHNCSQLYTGAWWYKNCHASNLCGTYLSGEYEKEKYAQGVVWQAFRDHYYSLKSALMMIRPQRMEQTL